MRLLSATVRAYRVHREITVVFDPLRNVIGGPNEAGKSTFAEAIHRALFFKAKGNTNEHRLMKSTLHPGTPEVELAFETGAGRYQLRKRFGSSGDTHLTPPRGAALTGEAAETELARVLGVEAGASAKTAAMQWAHLWVWQGGSMEDPTPHAVSQRETLLLRLQSPGDSTAMQSARDGRTAAAAAAAFEEIFTGGGKVKAGSELAAAEAALTEAEAAETAARARADALAESARVFSEAEARLGQLQRDAVDLSAQQDLTQRREAQIRQARQEEAAQAVAAAAAAERRLTLERQEAQIRGIRRELAGLEKELAPLEEAGGSLTVQREAARGAAAEAARQLEAATGECERFRRGHDWAAAWLRQDELAARDHLLRQRAVQVAGHQAELERLRLELAGLPPVDDAVLAALQKSGAAGYAAAAALTAMAAGVELVSGPARVLLDGQALSPGEVRILTEDGELTLADGSRLKIRPGGGTSLAAAREREQEARRRHASGLAAAGVASVEEAVVTASRRNELGARFLVEQAALKSLQAAGLPAALAEAQADLAAAVAETSRKQAALAGTPVPVFDDAAGARTVLQGTARALEEAEATARRARAGRDAAVRTAEAHAASLQHHEESLRARQLQHTGLMAQAGLLVTSHGTDEVRAEALAEALRHQGGAEAVLAETRAKLEALQPEHTERALERLQRSLKSIQEQRSEAETRRAVAADQLRSDGSQDPAADLAFAEAKAAAARESVRRLRRQAAARRLLHQTFTAEQAALAERFTQPLADRISGYLECLFGPGTRVRVVLEQQEFKGLEIQRSGQSGGAFGFAHLSGGTQEQTAAAVRLAMAEVLAADHDGCLPVVFDDAFTFSDASRLAAVQNMLDLAAARGLQVILFTHQPATYAALGAQRVSFS